jgi:hypothetical protein
MIFDPDEWYVIATHEAVQAGRVQKPELLSRVCSNKTRQREADNWREQKAVFVDDGSVEWLVTFSNKLAPDGIKRIAFVVGANRYAPDKSERNSRFWGAGAN